MTTEPAPINAYRPTVTPQTMVAFAPIVHPRFNWVVSYSECRFTCERGLVTFVRTHEGPRNTSSSMTDAGVNRHVVLNLDIVSDDCPAVDIHVLTDDDRWPIRAPFMTCEKCQIFVPAPISAPSSAYADSCTK